jgi:hypothetical protein
MDSIRDPLLFCCMIAVVGGMATMVFTIVFLVIRGALRPHDATSPETAASSGRRSPQPLEAANR